MNVILKLAVLVLLQGAISSANAQDLSSELCHPLIQELSAAALQQALVEMAEFPDIEIAERHGTVYVSSVGDVDGCLLSREVLPAALGSNVVLASVDQLTEIEARLSEPGLAYVYLSAPIIVGSNGSVGVQVEILSPRIEFGSVYCCCGLRMEFSRESGSWEFEREGIKTCE